MGDVVSKRKDERARRNSATISEELREKRGKADQGPEKRLGPNRGVAT